MVRQKVDDSDCFNVDSLGNISNDKRIYKMKNKLYSLLSFAFFVALCLDVLAFWIFEKDTTHLFAQIFLVGSLTLSAILCIPMLLLSDFRKAS